MTQPYLTTGTYRRLLQEKLDVDPNFLSQFDREADALPLDVQVYRYLQQEQRENGKQT